MSDKKSRILKAALQEFVNHGFGDAKIDQIAKVAGVGKGTVYQYFKSKEDLFECMIISGIESYLLSMSKACETSTTLEEAVYSLVQVHIDFLEEHVNSSSLFLGSCNLLSEKIQGVLQSSKDDLIKLLGQLIRKLVEKGQLRPDANFRLILAMLFGTMNQYYSNFAKGETENLLSKDSFAKQLLILIRQL